MRKRSLRRIIYPRIALTMLCLLLLFIFLAGHIAKQHIYRQSEDNLQEVSKLIENYIEMNPDEELPLLQTRLEDITTNSLTRISIIRDDGIVIVDTKIDPRLLNNHANRPEIYRAFQGIPNSVVRESTTLHSDLFYFAKKLAAPGLPRTYVLRISMPYTELKSAYSSIYRYIAIVCLIFVLLSLLLFYFLDRKIEQPLARLAKTARQYADFDFSANSLGSIQANEIQEVFASMHHMAERIKDQIKDVQHQQKALQVVLDGMREAVIVLNDQGRIIQTNPAAEEYFSTYRNGSLIGSYYLQVLRNSELNEIVETSLKDQSQKIPEAAIKIQLDDMFFQVHLSRIGTDEHKDVLLVLNDITTLMHLEQVRKDFVANVSHELKTPVTSIKGFTETLLYSDLTKEPENTRRFLTIINNQADRLQSIIDDLLMLSRLEQVEDRRENYNPIDLSQCIEDSVQICYEKPGNKDRTITIICDSAITIMGNALLIRQALINLIDNAVKYSEENQPVTIKCIQTKDAVTIEVKDRGYGIPSAALERIFERFYRVDKGRSRDKGGTGLGLSIVKHIMLKHQGCVSVSSTEGEGSTFTLSFPKKHIAN